jgi:hypothetical protein
MSSSPLPEHFIHSQFYGAGMDLPPLWQVIYQEAMRGHHLLFKRPDAERYDAELSRDSADSWASETLSDELELIVLKIIGCSELKDMVRVVDGLDDETRQRLYVFYRRVLWMWRNYVKERLN